MAREAYRAQIERVLEHRTPAGVRLADHPAVLAWDLLNEPRPRASTPTGGVVDWTEDMAGFIGTIDPRHLVTVGAEGFTEGYPSNPAMGARPGAEFESLCDAAGITMCSGHLFPKYLSEPSSSEQVNALLQRWRSTADRLNKPVVIGEVGYSLADPGHSRSGRSAFVDDSARAIVLNDIDGALLWNLGRTADDSFTLEAGEPESDRIIGSWASLIPRTP
jgi:mannan endo-1,4-beta-mannosidase